MAGLQRHARQVDVAAALEEQLAVGENFRFGHYIYIYVYWGGSGVGQ